jgi:GAF domain-containing protein
VDHERRSAERLDAALARLGTVVLDEEALAGVLDLVVEQAQQAVGPATAVSVTLLRRDGGAYTPSATADVARELDDAQYDSGRGPCLCTATAGVVSNVSLADESAQWPEVAAAAGAAGVGSVLSIPLTVGDGRRLGALNVYSKSPLSFADAERRGATLFAHQAAVVLANAISFSDAVRINDQLREALATRDLIGQAKGVLMERESCTPDEAFDILRRASQRTNHKLRDVAAEIVGSVARRRSRR